MRSHNVTGPNVSPGTSWVTAPTRSNYSTRPRAFPIATTGRMSNASNRAKRFSHVIRASPVRADSGFHLLVRGCRTVWYVDVSRLKLLLYPAGTDGCAVSDGRRAVVSSAILSSRWAAPCSERHRKFDISGFANITIRPSTRTGVPLPQVQLRMSSPRMLVDLVGM